MKILITLALIASSSLFANTKSIYFLYAEQSDDLGQQTAKVLVKANLPTVEGEDLSCSLKIETSINNEVSSTGYYTIGSGIFNDYYSLSVSEETYGEEESAAAALVAKDLTDTVLTFNLSDGYVGDFILVGGLKNIKDMMELMESSMPEKVLDLTKSPSNSVFSANGEVLTEINVECSFLQ